MATTNNTDIQQLYVAYFNRPADPVGLKFWADNIAAGKATIADVTKAFSTQAEYTAEYKDMTNAQIVDKVYQNLFGRSSAGDTGADFWVKGLENKTITIADVVTAVAAGAQLSDKTAFNNKVAAAATFTAALDTDAEIAGYKGDDANKVAKAFIASITTDVSFAAATTPTELNKTVANAVSAGTPFTVTGALASMDAAQTAVDKFVATIDTDGDGKTDDTVASDIDAAYTTAVNNVAAKLSSGSDLFKTTDSEVVRDALISATEATNAAALAAVQTKLSDANTAVSKVAGLSSAISALTAAQTAEAAADKAVVAASADVASKEGAFQVNNKGALSMTAPDVDGKSTLVLTPNDDGDATTTETPVTLGTIAASGKVTISSTIKASDYAGLTDLIAAYNTKVTAVAADATAAKATAAAQLEVNHLDIDATTVVSGKTEAQWLADVTATINTYATNHPTELDKVATGSTASEAQIKTALAVMEKNSPTDFGTFTTQVNNYHTAAESNPLTKEQTAETKAVKDANKVITDLASLVTKMDTAAHNVATLEGLTATLEASQDLLTAKGFHLIDADVSTIGTAASDIFTVASLDSGADVTLDLFNLQGTDSVFVGAGYKLVQGSIDDVKGDNAALEVFLSTNDDGDAVLQIETSAFGSSVTAGPEVITITLTGVDATTLHLNNGIISAGTIA
jgi:hypothetical protein